MKKIIRIFVVTAVIALLIGVFSVICFSEKSLIAEGYCVQGKDESGKVITTNIKWSVYNENGTGVIYFNIDKSVDSKNTVLHTRQKDGSDLIYWDSAHYTTSPWGEYTVKGTPIVKKAVIGEGITEINGAPFCGSKIESVEMPKTVVKLVSNSFARMSKLTTVNITGEAENPDVINLKYVTLIDGNTFEAANSAKKYILNPNYKGALASENFKQNKSLGELEIPAGVTKLNAKLFNETNNLARLIILGKDTEMSEATFEGMEKYPRIVGYKGSKAEAFAKANGYTFIDIETDKEIHKGTKPLAEPFMGEIEDPFIPVFEVFDPKGATAHGHMTGKWETTEIVNTYWAYYSDTKTLKLVSGTKEYNETGSSSYFDDKTGWKNYLDKIEHVVIGDYINKLSDNVFSGMKNLKDVELSRATTQMNSGVFKGCISLTTVYYRGKDRVEGQADFSGTKLETALYDTGIRVLKLGEKNTNPNNLELPDSITKIITPLFNDTFDNYCKSKKYDLQDANNPANIKKYFVSADTTKPTDTTSKPKDTTKPSDTTAKPVDTNKPTDTTTAKPIDTTSPTETTGALGGNETTAPSSGTSPDKETTKKPDGTTAGRDTSKPKPDATGGDNTVSVPDETNTPDSDVNSGNTSDASKGPSTMVIVIIIAVLAAAAAVVIFVIYAKKYLKK